MNGRIESYYDVNGYPAGPMRVWLKTDDIPGLAMSRSLGDRLAHTVGVSSEPEVTEHYLTSKDQIIVLASDGVWEFLSNEEVMEIIYPFYLKNSPEADANALVRAAY